MRVYIASPYRAKTKAEVRENVRVAKKAWRALVKGGHHPVCPQALSESLDPHGELSDEWWLEHTMELMRGCEAVLRLSGDSVGADAEVEEAIKLGIPVFMGMDDFKKCAAYTRRR